MALHICLQCPHLHHSGTGGAGCLGLSGVGGPSGACEQSSVDGPVEGPEITSWVVSPIAPEVLSVCLTTSRLMGDPCALIIGPSLSSSVTSWLWINSKLPMPLERTLMASLLTVSSFRLTIIFLNNKKRITYWFLYLVGHLSRQFT